MRHFDARAGVRCVSDSTVSVANSVHQKVAESMNHIQSSEHLSEKEKEEKEEEEEEEEEGKPQGTAQGRQGAATRSPAATSAASQLRWIS